MKRTIGSILCFVAILLIFNKIVGQKADTSAHQAQDWAAIGVIVAIGVALSSAKKNSAGTDAK